MTNPTEPTLTCSEVVERLAEIAESWLLPYPDEPIGDKAHNQCAASIANHIRQQAPAILDSWRERRVQELEEALRVLMQEMSDHREFCNDCGDALKVAEHALKGGGSHGE